MPARITIACEHCGAKLTLADDSKLGKKIKCPKCSEVFVAAADDDIEDVLEEDGEEEMQPRRKAAAAGKGAKGKAAGKGKKKSGGNLGLIIGGAVAVGVLLIGGLIGVLFATGVIGGGGAKSDPNQIVMTPIAPASKPAPPATPPAAASSTPAPSTTPEAPTNPVAANTPMPTKAADSAPTSTASAIPARSTIPETAKWLPANAELILHIRVADILASPLISEMLKANQVEGQLDAPLAPLGLKFADIESVISGNAGLEQIAIQVQQMQIAMATGQPPEMPASDEPRIIVFKLKKPLTYDRIMQLPIPIPMVKQQHAGKEYLEVTAPMSPLKSGIWLASDTEVIFGDDATLKAAMEHGPTASPATNFGFVDWTDHYSVAVAPRNLEAIKALRPPMGTGNPLFDQMIDSFVNGATGVSIGLAVKGGIDLEVAFGCVDEPKMEAIVKSLNDAVGLGKLQYDQSKKAIPPWAASLTDQLVANVAVKGENRVAVFSTNLPDSNQQQLVNLPAMIMTQMMLSAATSGGASAGRGDVEFSLDANMIQGAETIPAEAPENVKLTATLIDSPAALARPGAAKSKAKKKERVLDMTIAAQWTGEKEGCLLAAGGILKPKGGTAADGSKIKVAISKTSGLGVQTNELRPITLAEASEAAVELGPLQLTIADDETAPLKTVSGVCTLVTGTQVKLVTLPNITKLEGQEPEDEELKAAGLQVKLIPAKGADGRDQIVVSVKEGYLLSSLEAIDGEGSSVLGAMVATDKNERTQRLMLNEEIRQVKELGVQAYLYTDLKSVTVSFTFENLAIPKAMGQFPDSGINTPQN